ncbi:MAG: response regulator [bacterium]|nr:response regulator [bacterium]
MAKVFIAEDEENIRKLLEVWVRMTGHELVLEAATFEEAMDMVKLAHDKEVDLAIVDGTLKVSKDGELIAKALRENVPGIKVISHSAHKVSFGDLNLQKPISSGEFRQALSKLGF